MMVEQIYRSRLLQLREQPGHLVHPEDVEILGPALRQRSILLQPFEEGRPVRLGFESLFLAVSRRKLGETIARRVGVAKSGVRGLLSLVDPRPNRRLRLGDLLER